MASAPVYHAVKQLSDEQAKAHAEDIDSKVAAGQDQHGIPDLNTLWKHTYEDELSSRTGKLQLDADAAYRAANPTWRDKLAMMMDAANRASIVQGQNPALSKGQAWALATRGALDGWVAHAQGLHDQYSREQSAFEQQAHKDADEAVKRASDQFGLQAKADQMIEAKRHNQATEANNAIKDKATADKDKREGAKGDLVTLDADAEVDGKTLPKGSIVRVGADGKPHATGVSGTKTGTQQPGAAQDTTDQKAAEAALKDVMAEVEKAEAAKEKDVVGRATGTTKPLSAAEKAAQAKEILRTTNPRAYKTLYGNDTDVGAPAPAAAGNDPSWYKPPSK
jgi:hypothetical protein